MSSLLVQLTSYVCTPCRTWKNGLMMLFVPSQTLRNFSLLTWSVSLWTLRMSLPAQHQSCFRG